jgi:hypothetical protein
MSRGFSPVKIIGMLLLAAGVVVLAIGIYQFVEVRQSLAGRAAGALNRVFGSGRMPKGMLQSIIMMAGGAVGAVAGFFVFTRA